MTFCESQRGEDIRTDEVKAIDICARLRDGHWVNFRTTRIDGPPSAQSAQQKDDSDVAVATLKDQYNIVIRNNAVPHSLQGDSSQNAAPGTLSYPLRISTHLFHSPDDIDRVINALLEVVPHPEL